MRGRGDIYVTMLVYIYDDIRQEYLLKDYIIIFKYVNFSHVLQ